MSQTYMMHKRNLDSVKPVMNGYGRNHINNEVDITGGVSIKNG